MPQRPPKIVIVGETIVDMISGRYEKNLVNATRFQRFFGGSPANIATNLTQLGWEPLFVSRVGADAFGTFLATRLQSSGISIDHLQIDLDHHTSMVFVCKSKTTPSFFPARGADQFLEAPSDLDGLLEDARFLHFGSWALSQPQSRASMEKIMAKARQKGVPIGFDPNYRKVLWEKNHDGVTYLSEMMPMVDLCKPSDDDALHLFGKMRPEEALQRFHTLGVKMVVFSMGKRGVLVSDGKRVEHLFPLARKVQDTTGAGDAFWSGLYTGLVQGKSLFESARIGNAIAAFRVERIGGEDPLPPLESLLETYVGSE